MNVLHKMVHKLGITTVSSLALLTIVVVLHFLVGHLLLGDKVIGGQTTDQIVKNSVHKPVVAKRSKLG
jgi:hypothetical protein